MKRSWEDKLDPRGLEFIELAAKLRQIKPPSSFNHDELRKWTKAQNSVLSSYRNVDDFAEKRKVNPDPRFIKLLIDTDPECELSEEEMKALFAREEWPLFRAEQWELHERIALMFEENKGFRFQAYAGLAFAIVFLRRMFSSTWKKQFGTKKVGLFKMTSAIGQHFKWIGDLARGHVKPEPGRVNVELAGLVDTILRFQKEPLTQIELYEAVKAAGATVPEDPEAFRLWLHRARKDGLVTKFRSTRDPSDD
jgi:hypothetical protein